MPRTYQKKPRITRLCACGCGETITGTKRRMYAKPYCKLKSYLERKQDPNWYPDSKFNYRIPKDNPLNVVIPFRLGEEASEDVSSTVEAG